MTSNEDEIRRRLDAAAALSPAEIALLNGVGVTAITADGSLREVEPVPSPRYGIVGGWLAIEAGEHNCAGGTAEASGLHEPTCGWEPLVKVETLAASGVVVFEQDDARTEWAVQYKSGPMSEPYGIGDDARRRAHADASPGAKVVGRKVYATGWAEA